MLEQEELSVIEQYHKLKKLNNLSANLAEPTTAKLRNECAIVYAKRPDEEIRNILQSFAIPGMDIHEVNDILESTDVEKFKPLNNYLKGQIDKPNSNTLALLAWLIDYKKQQPQPNRNIPWFDQKYFSIGIMLIVGLIGYLLWPKDQCMYWNGERYVAVSCTSEDIEGVRIIALNKKRLKKFERIGQIDTINYKDIGRVWYMGGDTVPEFFTDSGMHPVDDKKQLKPITKYIIDKYILEQKSDSIK